nr:4'-phosphopantetheinyl transferase superfamily protein [Roseivivax sp. GX 12232]
MIAGLGAAWPRGVAVAICAPDPEARGLYPVEEAAVARAVAGRRSEFAGGRRAARRALAALGHPPVAIPMAEDRSPVWPEGFVGSVSHCAAACIAVVARTEGFAALGVDIEPYDPLPEDLLPEIGSEAELAGVGPDRRLAGRQLFSAKEAAYKAQYPLSRTLFGFDGLRYDAGARALRFARPVPPFARGQAIPVSQWTGDGLCLSLSALTAA